MQNNDEDNLSTTESANNRIDAEEINGDKIKSTDSRKVKIVKLEKMI